MTKKKLVVCPNCGALDKYPNAPKVTYKYGYPRNLPTTFVCGTTTSPDWAPPIYGKQCGRGLTGATP